MGVRVLGLSVFVGQASGGAADRGAVGTVGGEGLAGLRVELGRISVIEIYYYKT